MATPNSSNRGPSRVVRTTQMFDPSGPTGDEQNVAASILAEPRFAFKVTPLPNGGEHIEYGSAPKELATATLVPLGDKSYAQSTGTTQLQTGNTLVSGEQLNAAEKILTAKGSKLRLS